MQVVRNPPTPIYANATVEFQEEFVIKDSERGGQYLFAGPSSLLLDFKKNLYVLDAKDGNVKLFNEHGRLIRVMGRTGPGPGELIQPTNIAICRGELGVYSSADRRLTFFGPDGKFVRTAHSPVTLGQMKLDSSGNAFALVNVPDENGKLTTQLQKFDPSLRYVKTLSAYDWIQPQYFTTTATFELTKDDRIIYGYPYTYSDKYEIVIYDNYGTVLRKIQKNSAPVPIPRAEIDYLKKNYRPFLGTWAGVPEYYAPFYVIYTDNAGKIIVETRAKMTGRREATYDIFSLEGRFLACVTTKPLGNCLWANKRLYAIEEDDQGVWAVRIYRVMWSFDHSD